MAWFRKFSYLSQKLDGLSYGVLDQWVLSICYLKSSWNENDKFLQVIDEYAVLSYSIFLQVFQYFAPIKAINMQKIKLMVQDEDRWIAWFDLLLQCWLLLQYLLELWVILLNISNRFSETKLNKVVIFVLEHSAFGYVRVLKNFLMNVFFFYQKFQVDIEHNCSICNKDVLHIVIFIRPVLVPYEISDETLYHEPISAQLFKEIAFAFKHDIILSLA